MSAELHTLAGAYALDALTDTERIAFERHLTECIACSQEVRELRETAAQLGAAVAIQPPDLLRQKVLTEVAHTRQQSPGDMVGTRRSARSRRWTMRAGSLIAAAAVVAAIVLGVQVAQTQQRLHTAQQQLATISSVLGAGDATTTNGTGAHGGAGTAVLSPSHHEVVMMFSKLPPLASDRTYQVWQLGPGGPHSAGLLRSNGPTHWQTVVADAVTGANKVGVTVEPAGGSKQPSDHIAMLFNLG
ncbi:MAG: anti-sigma factor [Sciscionella sp.]